MDVRIGAARGRSLGAVLLVVLLASAGILLLASLRPSPGPAAATRYDDGIPRTWEGQPVLRGQAALDRAGRSTDATPFYVGLWYSSQFAGGCTAVEPRPLGCSVLHYVGDRAGVNWPALGNALRASGPDGPLVLRVHTHDPEWSNPSNCAAAELDACAHLMIGDEAVWSGDAATTPGPVAVEQAAAAFGVPDTETVLPACLTPPMAGVRILPFRDPASSTGYTYGVIAVFPSAAALAAAAPDAAATGETITPPMGYTSTCVLDGMLHWLARANVLVGVIEFSPSVGPAGDQWLVLARSELQRLPAD